MRFIRHKWRALVACLFFISSAAFAAGGGDDAPAGPLPKDQKEYFEKSSRLTTLANRIAEAEKQFKELVHQKNVAKTPEAKQEIIHQMVELNTQRNKDVDSYNKVKADLNYRYPNRGEHLNRQYETQSKRTVEEMEGVAGLDELLSHTKKVIERKFAPFKEDEKRPAAKSAAGAPGVVPEEKPTRLRLEK